MAIEDAEVLCREEGETIRDEVDGNCYNWRGGEELSVLGGDTG